MIKEYPNAIPHYICENIVSQYGKGLVRAEVAPERKDKGDTSILSQRVAEVKYIWEQTFPFNILMEGISEITNLPKSHQEAYNLIKYSKGGKYDFHHDAFNMDDPEHFKISEGNNRLYSVIIYLNDNFTGGNTSFFHINRIVKPEIGKVLIFKNLHSDGTFNNDYWHTGEAVASGEKWILTTWVRQKPFRTDV